MAHLIWELRSTSQGGGELAEDRGVLQQGTSCGHVDGMGKALHVEVGATADVHICNRQTAPAVHVVALALALPCSKHMTYCTTWL